MDPKERYLGVNLIISRNKDKTPDCAVEKMQTMLQGWQGKLVNQDGRTTQIQSSLSSTTQYQMSVFLLPDKSHDRINSIQRNYLWNKKKKKYFCSISWISMSKPKRCGGLGFKDSKKCNLSMLIKMAWRLVTNPEDKWAQLLKALYFPNKDPLVDDVSKRRSSWVWNNIQNGLKIVKQHYIWEIGDGKSVKVLKHNWIRKQEKSLALLDAQDSNMQGNADLMVADLINEDSKNWKMTSLNQLFNHNLVQRIRTIKIPREGQDKLKWSLARCGKFTTEFVYKELYTNKNHVPNSNNNMTEQEWLELWHMEVPYKLQQFLWKCSLDVLSVNKKLGAYIKGFDSICPMCNKEEETSSHLLLNCEFSEVVWFGMSSALHHSKNKSNSLHQWIKSWFSNNNSLEATNPDLAITTTCIMWHLWKIRCERVFQNKIYQPREVIQKIKSYINENIYRSTKNRITSRGKEFRQKPPKDWIKINIDASIISEFSIYGLALIIRDCTCGFLGAMAFLKVAIDVMQAESMILLKALQWIRDQKLQKVIVEGDNVSVINGCNGNLLGIPWEDHSLLVECQQILNDLSQCVVSSVRRGCNHAADLLAKHARRSIKEQHLQISSVIL